MLKYQLDSLDGIDESAHGLYEEKDGKFVLKVEGMPEAPDVEGLKKSRDTILAEKKKLQDEFKALQDAQEKAEREAAEKKGNVEEVRKHYQGDIDKLKADNARLLGKLHERHVHDEAVRIATANAVDTDSIETLAALIEKDLVMAEDNGEFVTTVKGQDGKPSGLTLDEYEKDLVKKKSLARLLKASEASGGGAAGSKSGGAAKPQKADMGGSKDERLAAIRERMQQTAA